MTMKMVYLSFPISGVPQEIFHAVEEEMSAYVRSVGDVPVSPLKVQACYSQACNGSSSPGEKYVHSWECYLRHDLHAVLRSNAILMAPGWTKSPGCRLEFQVASSVGLELWFFQLDTEKHLVAGGM